MTNWIKDSFLDLLSLLFIITYAVTLNNVVGIIIWVYSSLLLISKILYISTNFFQLKASKTTVPDLLYHLIYLFNLIALLYVSSYYLAALWAIIWILSTLPKVKSYVSKKGSSK